MTRTDKPKRNLYLGGFMASGKSSVGRELASMTGRSFLDLDQVIEMRAGKSVAEIFVAEGESRFREMEREVLEEVSELENAIVALGGGVLVDPSNRAIVEATGQLAILEVLPDTVRRRAASEMGKRPLLRGDGVERLMEKRKEAYRCGDVHVETDGLSVQEVADVVRGACGLQQLSSGDRGAVFRRKTSHGTVVVGRGILQELEAFLGEGTEPFVVADRLTGPLFAERLGANKGLAMLPRGEEAKTLDQVRELYRVFGTSGLDRSGTVVALGGGTVGDTAGFAAATWMRGVGLVQCPTTLLAQVDSAIGGKVGVNLPEGKNLVGAFYQPRLVLVDVDCLASLSARDYRQGLAEVVKYGLGEDRAFFDWLESHADGLLQRDPQVLIETVARCAGLKLDVVAEDEKERTGARARLNLGHTVGHSLESASGYRDWQHGDGVAAGMVVATELALMIGDCGQETLESLMALLARLDLPRFPDRPWEEILPHLVKDKKFEGGRVRLVLPSGEGRSRVRDDIPLERLQEAYVRVMGRGQS